MRTALFLERGRPRDRLIFGAVPFLSISIERAREGDGFGARGSGPNCFCSDSSIKWRNDDARTVPKGRSRSVGRTRRDVKANEIFLGLFSIFMGGTRTRVTRTTLLHALFRLQSSHSCTLLIFTARRASFPLCCLERCRYLSYDPFS